MLRNFIIGLLSVLMLGGFVSAAETTISVRVLAKDAKFIGTSMGGVEVTLRDVATGTILAKGLTAGGTGNTRLIMNTPKERYSSFKSEGSALYTATINIDEPTLIEVSVRGPLSPNASAVAVSSQQWVVPGKHITEGDGWLLELRGLVVEAIELPEEAAAGPIKLEAKVRMMCGCPTQPEGLWDSDKMEINAIVKGDGGSSEVSLVYTGKTSHFATTVPLDAGDYDIIFYAYQPATGNTGVLSKRLRIK